MKRYYKQGIAAKGHDGHEDGDSMLWAGLLLAAGETAQEDAILACQEETGEFKRAPSRVGVPSTNSFSRDMATGLTLGAASSGNVRHVYKRWIAYTLDNRCMACKDHDGRCFMTPGVYWWAHYMGIDVPFYYRWTAFLNRLYLFIACFINPPGYQLHLAGVSLFIQKKIGQWGYLERRAAAKLAKRQPANAFFQWLAGDTVKAKYLVEEVKHYIASEGQGRMHQWGWEREDAERAWKDSCGHDIVFMDLLLNEKQA